MIGVDLPRILSCCLDSFATMLNQWSLNSGWIAAKRFPIWSLDLDSLLDPISHNPDMRRGRFLKAVNKSQFPSSSIYLIDLILISCTVFQTLALPESICDLSLPTLALTMVVFCLEKPTAIASRKCCVSSTRQIKTSFLLH